MNKLKKILSIIGIVFVLAISTNCVTVYATNDKQNEINYKEKEVQLKDDYVKFKMSMESEWLNQKFELYKQKIDNENMWVKVITICGGIVIVIGIVGKDKIEKEVNNRIDNEMEKKLNKLLNKKENEIKEFINKISMEQKLKSKKILIIYKKYKNDCIESLLKQFDIKFMEYQDVINNIEKFDIVIFESMCKDDNNDKIILAEDIKNIIDINNNKLAVYLRYGPYMNNKSIIENENINFANSPITLYSNLINALEFQEIFLKNN